MIRTEVREEGDVCNDAEQSVTGDHENDHAGKGNRRGYLAGFD